MSPFKLIGFCVLAPLAVGVLGGCRPAAATSWDASGNAGHGGRYEGVGIYNPGAPWTKLEVPKPESATAAKLSDDQAVIVVVDSETGEVRACGDLSGYCVGMNPWTAKLASLQRSPVSLTAHQKPQPAEPATNTDTAAASDH